jgi:hypothetical protein
MAGRFEKNDGVSDTLHGDLVKKHMVDNIKLNAPSDGTPIVNLVGEWSDNQGVRTIPGRKRGIFSD